MKASSRKLMIIATSLLFTTIWLSVVPFIQDYFLLMTSFVFIIYGIGSFDVMDNSLMVSMLGADLSRPFVQSLHAFKAVGLLAASFLVPLFLPKSASESEAICQNLGRSDSFTSALTDEETLEEKFNALTLPFIIVAAWICIAGLGFIVLVITGLQLPEAKPEELELEETHEDHQNNNQKNKFEAKIQLALMIMAAILIFLVNGLDNLFQSFIYTIALCGPLRLPASTAGWLNTLYYSSYFIGRMISIPLAAIFSPAKLIFITSIGCLVSTLILCFWGNTHAWALFLSMGLMGFCLCFHFGSAINWLNSKTEKSYNISFIYMGANLSSLCYPTLGSKLFHLDPSYVAYLSIISVVALVICFIGMNVLAKKLK